MRYANRILLGIVLVICLLFTTMVGVWLWISLYGDAIPKATDPRHGSLPLFSLLVVGMYTFCGAFMVDRDTFLSIKLRATAFLAGLATVVGAIALCYSVECLGNVFAMATVCLGMLVYFYVCEYSRRKEAQAGQTAAHVPLKLRVRAFWVGKKPLWATFWGGGLCVPLLFGLSEKLALLPGDSFPSMVLLPVVFVPAALAVLFYCAWLVALWRCAGNYEGMFYWRILARVFSFLGFLGFWDSLKHLLHFYAVLLLNN